MAKRAEVSSASAVGASSIEVRLDKWLWAARFFKTRQLAIDAVNAGRVDVNGERAKPAKSVKAGDELLVRKPPYAFYLTVTAVSEKRGSASIAQTLYRESEAGREARQRLSAELRELPPPVFKGRPTKRDRRTIERFMERHADDE